MQTKLHCWATADRGRRFGDLFNLVHDPGFLLIAWDRVAGNVGARTAGVDRTTVRYIAEQVGVEAFLNDIRAQLRGGRFQPSPVLERKIPKAGGKLRSLGIPTVRDRVVQAALKLLLEPIFEADFTSVSYGFRPNRRAHDAIAEIHYYGTKGYRWILDSDIEACFDSIDHSALMDQVRKRIKDKKVLALVKSFLKAGIMTESGLKDGNLAGTPQGGILSPLLANVALSALDEHFVKQWDGWSKVERARRKRRGLGAWRIVRYADDFVVMVNGSQEHVEALRAEVQDVLDPLGLRLSEAKTRVVHMQDGFDFLGFHIKWMPKRGTTKWYVYTFIADKPVREFKRKIRSLTHRRNQNEFGSLLYRINQIQRGWANYFKHAVAKHTFNRLQAFVWWRVVNCVMYRHRLTWTAFRRRLKGPNGWRALALDGVQLFNIASTTVSRYRWRGNRIPSPWPVEITTRTA
ncbi:group II intron reverse transcriptase/maturase [Streptomyces lavendulae]|uniref:group II intron reverse transcriptase/maturase n=1 Tax=Streptomyces lavendulae TaxID=1914 RepID=UPI00371E8DAC